MKKRKFNKKNERRKKIKISNFIAEDMDVDFNIDNEEPTINFNAITDQMSVLKNLIKANKKINKKNIL